MGDIFGAWFDRDVVRVSGPDAATFLHGQMSQDITGLAVGATAWTLLLQPTGRLTASLRVTRESDTSFLLDVATGWAEPVMARLSRFRIRVACDIEEVSGWRMLSVRGATFDAPTEEGERTEGAPAGGSGAVGSATIVAPPAGRSVGVVGYDLVGNDVVAPDGVTIDDDAVEAERVRVGVPAMGAELDDTVIPAEMGAWFVEEAVSWTKGCYTGQELVARVDSRGSNTPLRLRSVELSGPAAPGDEVLDASGAAVGRITSVFGVDALARVGRAVEPPADVTVAGAPAVVRETPPTRS